MMNRYQVLILCDDNGKTIYEQLGMMPVIRRPAKRRTRNLHNAWETMLIRYVKIWLQVVVPIGSPLEK